MRGALVIAALSAATLWSCAEERANGSPCLKDADCASGYCRSGTCVPPPVNTQATTATVSASSSSTGGTGGVGGAEGGAGVGGMTGGRGGAPPGGGGTGG